MSDIQEGHNIGDCETCCAATAIAELIEEERPTMEQGKHTKGLASQECVYPSLVGASDTGAVRAVVGAYFDPKAADDCDLSTLLILLAEIEKQPCAGGECPGPLSGKRSFGDPFRCRRCWAISRGVNIEGHS